MTWRLDRFDWLQEIPALDLRSVRNRSRRREYERRALVFAPSPMPQSVYLLTRGLVRIYRMTAAGDQTTFGFVSPGEVFGELAALGDHPRESFADAVTRSTVWRIPRSAFVDMLASHPILVLELAKQVGRRFKRMESRVEDLVFHGVRTRVAHILLQLAEDFGREVDGRITLDLPLTQGELAKLVGATRQSVNTSLRELESLSLIQTRRRRIVVTEPGRLAEIARAEQS